MRTTVWSSTIRTRMGSAGTVVTTRSPRGRDREWRARLGLVAVERHLEHDARAAAGALGSTARRPPSRRARSRMLRRPSWRPAAAGGAGAAAAAVVGHRPDRARRGANTRTTCTRQAPAWRAVFESASRRICSRCWPASSGSGPAAPMPSARKRTSPPGLLGEAPGEVAEPGRDALGRGGRLGQRADVVADAVGDGVQVGDHLAHLRAHRRARRSGWRSTPGGARPRRSTGSCRRAGHAGSGRAPRRWRGPGRAPRAAAWPPRRRSRAASPRGRRARGRRRPRTTSSGSPVRSNQPSASRIPPGRERAGGHDQPRPRSRRRPGPRRPRRRRA